MNRRTSPTDLRIYRDGLAGEAHVLASELQDAVSPLRRIDLRKRLDSLAESINAIDLQLDRVVQPGEACE
jgi:hypothetical protein